MMIKAKDIERKLTEKTFDQLMTISKFVKLTDLEDRNSHLRKSGLLPKGGRGIYAPSISCRDAAVMLLGLSATRIARDAAKGVKEYGDLVPVNAKNTSLEEFNTLLDALEFLIANPETASNVVQIRIFHNAPIAEIEFEKIVIKFMSPGDIRGCQSKRLNPMDYGRQGPGTMYFFGGGIIHQLALDFGMDYNADWSPTG